MAQMASSVDVVVLGAGIVGVSAAVHLQRRGHQTALVDRQAPGLAASFGNGGLVQSEAVMPYLFPHQVGELLRYARNRSTDAVFHLGALPDLLGPFFRYWRNSTLERAMTIARARAPLVQASTQDHLDLATEAGVQGLFRSTGWTQVYSTSPPMDLALKEAAALRANFDVTFEPLSGSELLAHEPALRTGLAGAVHWPKPLTVTDPHSLTVGYAGLLERLGGQVLLGDARTLRRAGTRWRVSTQSGDIDAREVVIAVGAWAPEVAKSLGYSAPFFVKRGYHRHYAMLDGVALKRPVLDAENGYLLAPMRQGLRLTTGAEFARRDAKPTPIQLLRTDPLAHQFVPALGDPVERVPWMGSRPCLPDMLPVIGPAPGQPGVWFDFGHAHHGLTMGPSCGRLLSQMILGEHPFTDPKPYRADRF